MLQDLMRNSCPCGKEGYIGLVLNELKKAAEKVKIDPLR